MAGVRQPIEDLLSILKSMPELAFVQEWNNQIVRLKAGEIESFLLPAAFVEFVSFNNLVALGGKGVTQGDIVIRIHIAHEFYDAGDGTMSQNLEIYDLKDAVVRRLCDTSLTACSTLQRTGESKNNDHDNITEYTLEYTTAFTDSVGSMYDEENGRYILKQPPTDLEVNNSTGQGSGTPYRIYNNPLM